MKKKETKEKQFKENVVYVDGPEEAAKANKSRINSQKKKMITLLAVLAIVITVVIVMFLNREYKGYKVVKSSETNYENTAGYVQFSGNLLKYTPDGVSYINSNGDTVWSAGIDMKMPMVVVSGNYAVVL